jgi:tetratricopeptide (TPR) repeat protein
VTCAVILAVCLVATPTLVSQEVGDEVVVIAEQKADIKDELGVVGTVSRGRYLVVREIKGDHFFVSGLLRNGWINKSDVLPLDKALPYFTEEIGRSAVAQNYFGRANVHHANGRYDEAIDDCNNALRSDSKFSPAYRNRGVAWAVKGELDKAAADLDEAIRLDPQDAIAYFNRGLVRHAKGEYDLAIADCDVLLGMNSDLPWAFIIRGNARAAKGEHGKAVADFSTAIRLDPEDAMPYGNRGKARLAKGEYGKAKADFEEALRLEPTSPRRYNALAWVLATCPDAGFRDGKKAVEHATKACELTNWQDFGWLDTLAAAYAESGDFDRAVKWQRKAIELAPEKWQVELRSRLHLYESGEPYREKRVDASGR